MVYTMGYTFIVLPGLETSMGKKMESKGFGVFLQPRMGR